MLQLLPPQLPADCAFNLLPRRRAADDVPVRADGDLIRQLMLQGEFRRYVSTISRIPRKFRPPVGMRIENHDLFAELVMNQLNWTDEIRVAANPTFLIIGKLEKVSDGNCGLSASFGNIAA